MIWQLVAVFFSFLFGSAIVTYIGFTAAMVWGLNMRPFWRTYWRCLTWRK